MVGSYRMKWRQEDIVLSILQEHHPVTFDAHFISTHMCALGYEARKRKIETIRAVLSRLVTKKKVERVGPGVYRAVM